MAFADLLDPNTYARRDSRNYSDLVAAALKNQQATANIAETTAQTQGLGLTNEYNQATMDPRVAQAGSVANQAASTARSAGLKLPEEEIQARMANLNGQRLSAMGVPGLQEASQQQPGLPPPTQQAAQLQAAPDGSSQSFQAGDASPTPNGAAETPVGQAQTGNPPMPAIFSHYQSMDLNQLRQAKMEDDQGGGYMKQFIDPALNMKIAESKKEMYDALNSDEWKKKIGSLGYKATNASQAFNEFRSKYPVIGLLPEAEQAKIQSESFKPNAQPNGAMIMNTPPPTSVLDNAIARIAEGKSTISKEMKNAGRGGPAAQIFHDQLAEGVPAYTRPGETAPLRPDFEESSDEGGNAFAQSPKVKSALTQMENAYSTVGRLRDVFGKLKNGQFPDLNAAINAGAVHVGDVDAARANIAAILGNDELTKAFAGGGVPTDKLREMAGALVNKNLAPEQMNAQFDELLQGTERQYNAYQAQSAGHIKPLDVKKYGGGAQGVGGFSPAVVSQAKAYLALPADQQDPKVAAHARKALGQ